MINPNISENELWAARGAAAGGNHCRLFRNQPPGLLPRSSHLFGLAAASLFPAIILGIFDKKMNKEGAIAGMIIGLLLMLFYMLKFKFGLLMVERCCCWLKRKLVVRDFA
jgi:cation/acetate symporter